jgi:protein-S-isoprenylcysteine O-methyltransferase Ste14
MASAGRSIAVSVVFTLFGGPGIFLVFVPWWLTRFRVPTGESLAVGILGGIVIVAGIAPLLESIWRFVFVGRGSLVPAVPTEHLVVSGLYRYVRNPMYVGVLTAIAGEALLLQSRGLAVELLCVWLGFELFVRLYEEPRLMQEFPREYDLYRRHVRRWLPRLTPWDGV